MGGGATEFFKGWFIVCLRLSIGYCYDVAGNDVLGRDEVHDVLLIPYLEY